MFFSVRTQTAQIYMYIYVENIKFVFVLSRTVLRSFLLRFLRRAKCKPSIKRIILNSIKLNKHQLQERDRAMVSKERNKMK